MAPSTGYTKYVEDSAVELELEPEVIEALVELGPEVELGFVDALVKLGPELELKVVEALVGLELPML